MIDPTPRVFRVGSESDCELIIERSGTDAFTFAVMHYAKLAGFGPAPFPLGCFLAELGLTAEDCAAALEGERSAWAEPGRDGVPDRPT